MLDEGCGDLDALARARGARPDRRAARHRGRVHDATLARPDDARAVRRARAGAARDMLARPRLDAADFDRVRDLRLNRLLQLRDMPPALAERAFTQLLYGAHPYGHLPIGTEASLRAMDSGEARAFHQRMYDPSRGDGDRRRRRDRTSASRASIETAFGRWQAATTGRQPSGSGDAADRRRGRPSWWSCRGPARRNRSCASATWPRRAERRRTTTRSSRSTWCSAASSSAGST